MSAVDPTPSRTGGRALLVALFVVYLALLAWSVLWKFEVPWIGEAALRPRPIKLIPFLPSGDAGASAPQEVVANLLLFVPFGLYLGLLAPGWQWWKAACVFVGASLALEVTQHLISTGSFDIKSEKATAILAEFPDVEQTGLPIGPDSPYEPLRVLRID